MYLDVGDGHQIYYELHGNPEGRPAVVLHGGPGGGLQRSNLKFFNLRKWRVLLFDQRGSGRSKPYLGLEHNTTWDLVADIERLRTTVGVERWTVFGGSWGSTLALAYASKHAAAVQAMVVRGIYLAERWENEWLYAEGGASRLFADEWKRFAGPRKTLKQTLDHYGKAFRSKSRKTAVKRWNQWESSISFLGPSKPSSDTTPSLAILEHHYFKHGC